MLGVAQTGTGKTAAFFSASTFRIDESVKAPQILCLAPTRELALQVAEAIEGYAENLPKLRVVAVYGGPPRTNPNSNGELKVVGTPGRIMDHIEKGYLKLDNLQALVLDEADEMLSMGFIEDINWILEHTPEERQIALFPPPCPSQFASWRKTHADPVEITIK